MKATYRSIDCPIAQLLKPGDFARKSDQTVFNKWMHKQIPTEMAIQLFKDNNGVPEGVEIKPENFVKWLNSIGWKR